MQVSILVGTMTGTAELVAGDVQKALEDKGHSVEVLLMDTLKADVFERPGTFLICTSTYGQGDVPDNARDRSEAHTSELQSLMRTSYAVFCLKKKKTYITQQHNIP